MGRKNRGGSRRQGGGGSSGSTQSASTPGGGGSSNSSPNKSHSSSSSASSKKRGSQSSASSKAKGTTTKSVVSSSSLPTFALLFAVVLILISLFVYDQNMNKQRWMNAILGRDNGPTAEQLRGYRARLRQLYSKHNPDKLPEIDDILSKWRGREKQLFKTLHNKYRSDPTKRKKAEKKRREKKRPGESEEERIERVKQERAKERAERKRKRQEERDGKDYYEDWEDGMSPSERKKHAKYFGSAEDGTVAGDWEAEYEGEIEMFDDSPDSYKEACHSRTRFQVSQMKHRNWDLVWMAPFLSGGGYCSEASDFIKYLWNITEGDQKRHAGYSALNGRVWISQHGDGIDHGYLSVMDHRMKRVIQDTLISMNQHQFRERTIYDHSQNEQNVGPLISVCHSEPGAWHPGLYSTSKCPILGYSEDDTTNIQRPYLTIGRTMFETDRLPDGWPARLAKMDAIWVPTQFHAKIFQSEMDRYYENEPLSNHDDRSSLSTLKRTQIAVLGESVDTDLFKNTMQLDVSQMEKQKRGFSLLRDWSMMSDENDDSDDDDSDVGHSGGSGIASKLNELWEYLRKRSESDDNDNDDKQSNRMFVFSSVFKFEDRKGWEELFEAFLNTAYYFDHQMNTNNEQHSNKKDVILLVKTSMYHNNIHHIHSQIRKFLKSERMVDIWGDKYNEESKQKKQMKEECVFEIWNHRDGRLDFKMDDCHSSLSLISFTKIFIIADNLSVREMSLFYELSDWFVIPSKGEGWGRPHMESMSAGTPVICTDWSGPTEYIRDGINGLMIPIHPQLQMVGGDGPFRRHRWAKVDMDQFKEILIKVAYEMSDEQRLMIARSAQETVRNDYCIECIGLKILELIDQMI